MQISTYCNNLIVLYFSEGIDGYIDLDGGREADPNSRRLPCSHPPTTHKERREIAEEDPKKN